MVFPWTAALAHAGLNKDTVQYPQVGNTIPATRQQQRNQPRDHPVTQFGQHWAAFTLLQLLQEQLGRCKCSPMQTQCGNATARWGRTTLVAALLGVCSQPQASFAVSVGSERGDGRGPGLLGRRSLQGRHHLHQTHQEGAHPADPRRPARVQ